MQEEYSAAHQCFITDNSLYVLCWRACDGEDGILELKDWLLTIKVRMLGTRLPGFKSYFVFY